MTEHKSRSRNSKLDFLRISFATLVLLAHAPELTDGNNSREILSRLTHSQISFGVLGVDGFFLLSGYLIVKSWIQNPEFLNFILKRILRIVPGYLVAVFLSISIVGLLAPGVPHFFSSYGLRSLKSILLLSTPSTPPVFPGLRFQEVNNSLWTIAYEFRCYLIVAAFGVLGLLRRRLIWLLSTVLFLSAFIVDGFVIFKHFSPSLEALIGEPTHICRLSAAFFVGGCFYIFREQIKFRPMFAIAVAVALILGAINPKTFEPGLVLFGGYLMFYFAQLPSKSAARSWHFPDISYGIYLYGWPVESLWIWYSHGSPWVTFLASTVICCGLGWLSWHLVERPMLRLKRKSSVALPE